jgi:hypothetical protein
MRGEAQSRCVLNMNLGDVVDAGLRDVSGADEEHVATV